ncbi:digestive cysteine proteinase 2-like [Lineus longissimus]|uniref:digestive cysteine proteinase 2-like n=1 Tax=Lineus longissimus TaxID=88925 RepID=UPI002B4CD99D
MAAITTSLVVISVLALFAGCCNGATLFFKSAEPPTWGDAYQVSATLHLPYAEIEEPIYAFYDAKAKMSRIDYYNAVVSTIQRADQGNFGKSYKVAPMSDYTAFNKKTCFLVNGTKNATVTIQAPLPDLKGYMFVRSESLNDIVCDVWQNITVSFGRKSVYTMWVDKKTQSPVRYIMMGYDSLLGSHYDKYVIDYKNFNNKDKISPTTFAPPKGMTCGGFPGPGAAEHRILQNPISEYVNNNNEHIEEMFDGFKRMHKPQYKNETEHNHRKDIFTQNIRFIHSKNRAGLTYTLKANHLADRTSDELKYMRGRLHSTGYNGGLPFNMEDYKTNDLPDSLDWRLFGAVTPVKDQAVCGSCWSFGTTGHIEGALFMKTGKLVRLSQQHLMDCSWGEGNNACDGGEDFRAYQYIMKNKGLSSEEAYGPYLGQDGLCHSRNVSTTVNLRGYVNVTSGDLTALKVAVANQGPISVGIDASHTSLAFYSNGVYYEPDCRNGVDDLDHAVLAVGYGVLHGQAYWLVKNSWSTYWGNDGYVLMSQKNNNCGVATQPTFVVL